MARAIVLAAAGWALMATLQAADDPPVPSAFNKDQKANILKFLKGHEAPERYVPKTAKFVDDPPSKAATEIVATKEKPIKQYTVQITPHRPVPGNETVNKADIYFYRPNPEKGKPGITVKHTVNLNTGEQIGETEVLTKAHTPISREELSESVEQAKVDSPALKALYAGREPQDVTYEYLQMRVSKKSDTMEPGDRVLTLTFTAAVGENEKPPKPVRVIVNLTKGTVLPGDN